jgi:hypothetical protein
VEILKIEGDGSGYGAGAGAWYWYGAGAGDVSREGSWYGYGAGDWYGDGSGGSSWYGYGAGDFSGYWMAVFNDYFKKTTGQFLAFWKSDDSGRPSNGGSGTVASNGLVEKIDGPLKICTRRALHATTDPTKYYGDRVWLVDMRGELQFQDDKVGALEREIICELKQG